LGNLTLKPVTKRKNGCMKSYVAMALILVGFVFNVLADQNYETAKALFSKREGMVDMDSLKQISQQIIIYPLNQNMDCIVKPGLRGSMSNIRNQ